MVCTTACMMSYFILTSYKMSHFTWILVYIVFTQKMVLIVSCGRPMTPCTKHCQRFGRRVMWRRACNGNGAYTITIITSMQFHLMIVDGTACNIILCTTQYRYIYRQKHVRSVVSFKFFSYFFALFYMKYLPSFRFIFQLLHVEEKDNKKIKMK